MSRTGDPRQVVLFPFRWLPFSAQLWLQNGNGRWQKQSRWTRIQRFAVLTNCTPCRGDVVVVRREIACNVAADSPSNAQGPDTTGCASSKLRPRMVPPGIPSTLPIAKLVDARGLNSSKKSIWYPYWFVPSALSR